MLEHACGEDAVAPLWRIRHHDLFDMYDWQSLDVLAERFVPEIKAQCERKYTQSLRRNAARWPEVNHMTPDKLFIGDKLAKARRDVDLTYAVFSRGSPPD